MKIKLILFSLLVSAACFAQTAGPGIGAPSVIVGPSRAGPVPGLNISPDGQYDIGAPNKERPGKVYVSKSVNINGGELGYAQYTLTSANILAMYATPVALIPAQGSGKSIVVTRVVFKMVASSTNYASGGAPIIQYGTSANGAGTQACDSDLTANDIIGSAGTTISTRIGASIDDLASASIQNVGLYISNKTGAFTTGTGTAVIGIWFTIL